MFKNNVIHHITALKEKSTDHLSKCKKRWKNSTLFIIKTFSKRKPWSNDTAIALSTSSKHIFVSESLSNKRNQCCLKKWMILELKQGKYKISHEHFVVPDSRGSAQKRMGMSNDRRYLKELSVAKGETIWTIK